jgi:hypothetical protein
LHAHDLSPFQIQAQAQEFDHDLSTACSTKASQFRKLFIMSLEEELRSQIATVPFVELEPHVVRQAVVVIDDGLDLVQVAMLFAKDSKDEVSRLLNEELIAKATLADSQRWRYEKRFFNMIIVQPFVLVQSVAALNGTLNN